MLSDLLSQISNLITHITTTFEPKDFTKLDAIALLWFWACMMGYNYVIRTKAFGSNNLLSALYIQRRLWMQNMSERSNRVMDIQIIGWFIQTNGFFATTSVLILGGLIAVFSSGSSAHTMIENIPYIAPTSLLLWRLKIALLIVVFIMAFFKFIWAYRLSNYAGIAMGATPAAESINIDLKQKQVELVATLTDLAARHSYVGLRSYYFGFAAIGWFVHPVLFIISTTWIVLVLYRREFLSRSAHAINKATHG